MFAKVSARIVVLVAILSGLTCCTVASLGVFLIIGNDGVCEWNLIRKSLLCHSSFIIREA